MVVVIVSFEDISYNTELHNPPKDKLNWDYLGAKSAPNLPKYQRDLFYLSTYHVLGFYSTKVFSFLDQIVSPLARVSSISFLYS